MTATTRHVFHLAFPVRDLAQARAFYVERLGARVGREGDAWLDILLWGHQITLHERPDEVLPREEQGVRHFGVVLPWAEWEALAERLRADGGGFLHEPRVLHAGTRREQAKLHLEDPSHHVLEIKAYRDADGTLHTP